jgi:ABC-2 type transport system ATP-binding protein
VYDDGTTVLPETPYLDVADELCDRVAAIDHGRILVIDDRRARPCAQHL